MPEDAGANLDRRRPGRDDLVVILGAGAAGIHMAYELDRRGFRNLLVIERLNRVGGKVLSFHHEGHIFDLGALFLPLQSAIGRICSEMGVEVVTIPNDAFRLETGFEEIVLEYRRFTALVRSLEEKTRRDFVDHETARTLSLPFSELLDREHFSTFKKLSNVYLHIYGYGTIEEVAAYYAVLGCRSWIADLLTTNVGMVPNGYASVFETMAARAKLEVAYKTEVTNIDEAGRILTLRDDGGATRHLGYDFLINSIPQVVRGDSMKDIFSPMRIAEYRVAVVESKTPRPMLERHEGASAFGVNVTALALKMKGSADPAAGDLLLAYQAPDHAVPQAVGAYASGPVTLEDDAHRILVKDLTEVFAHDPKGLKVIHTHSWPYFPRFTRDQIARGDPWTIRRLQGENDTWNIGASCCFESVSVIVDYNLGLLERVGL